MCRPLVLWEFFRGVHKSGLNLPRVCQIDLKSQAYCLLLDDFNIVWAVAPDWNKRHPQNEVARIENTCSSMSCLNGIAQGCGSPVFIIKIGNYTQEGLIQFQHSRMSQSIKNEKECWRPKKCFGLFSCPSSQNSCISPFLGGEFRSHFRSLGCFPPCS